jgi:kynurenine formamidase
MTKPRDIFRRNWGRWGDADERGTLNLVDDAYVRNLFAQPIRGRIYALGLEVGAHAPAFGRPAPIHYMNVDGGDFAALERLDDFGYADDSIVMATHSSTHIDALAHVMHAGHLYNGFSWREVRSSGAAKCGIDKVGAVVCKAHVFDFASDRGVDTLSEDVGLGPDDLEGYRQMHEIEVAPGDAILVRTGFVKTLTQEPSRVGPEPGLLADCADWIADYDIALVGADNSAVERFGPLQRGAPLHERLVCGVGCYFVELLDLEQLSRDAVRSGVLIISPLKIQRGVGSPVNPVLIT